MSKQTAVDIDCILLLIFRISLAWRQRAEHNHANVDSNVNVMENANI